REKRENTLRALARKNAAKVKKYGRNIVLDPMNPYERRIIHTTIQEIEGVSSHSVGNDDGRKVVITLEEGFKPTNGGGYNRNRRGGRNDNHGRRERAPKYEPQSNNRPPLSDSSSASLYGKIEVNK
ncbi:MAG: single-stranded DNA-binding protein, partial [Clostridia bacterium]|nr:single-stranded DNA-binding protein [Clostridia bacterium]